jgi:hypothetical protein
MTRDEIQRAMDDVLDQALEFHGDADYIRDYEMCIYATADPRTGIAPEHLRYRFVHAVKISAKSAVLPDVWNARWTIALSTTPATWIWTAHLTPVMVGTLTRHRARMFGIGSPTTPRVGGSGFRPGWGGGGARMMLTRVVTVVGVAVVAALMPLASAVAGGVGVPAPVCSEGRCVVVFRLVRAPQTFTVPAGVAVLTATVAGAAGGHDGGPGGTVVTRVPVAAVQSLTVVVGGQGGYSGTGLNGGYGGGGDSGATGGGGGGGSFLFAGRTTLIAAGGGGGGGATSPICCGPIENAGVGGAGGAGGAGSPGPGTAGGDGATTTAPGGGGTGPAAGPATFGTGGRGGPCGFDGTGAGGGGGGFNGGGSGRCTELDMAEAEGGGGGGSGMIAAGVTGISRGTNGGDGRVQLSYLQASSATSLTLMPAAVRAGGSLTVTARVTSGAGAVSGTVVFARDGMSLGTARLVNGSASLVLRAGNTPGRSAFSARFTGAAGYRASTSPPVMLTISAAPPTTTAPATPTARGAQLANSGVAQAAGLAGLAAALLAAGGLMLALAASTGSAARAGDTGT